MRIQKFSVDSGDTNRYENSKEGALIVTEIKWMNGH